MLHLTKFLIARTRNMLPMLAQTSVLLQKTNRMLPALLQRRPMGNCCPEELSPELKKLRERQELFQEENEEPIFLKGGPKDKLLYRSTWALCILGLLMQVKLFFDLIIKPFL